MIKRMFFTIAVILLLVAAGFGIYKELGKNKKELLSDSEEKQKIVKLIPVWLRTNKEIIRIQGDLNTLAEYRVKNRCVDNTINQSFDCESLNQRFNSLQVQFQDKIHQLELQAKSPESIAKAVSQIKSLREDQSLIITFIDIKKNLYSNNGRDLDVYEDNLGMQYLVDPAYSNIVQMSPASGAGTGYRVTPQLAEAQLKKKAEAFLAKHLSDFDQVKNSGGYTYTETSKDGKAWAFRWEYKNKPEGEDVAPFVQVVISPAGDVMSFNDTRSIYFVKEI